MRKILRKSILLFFMLVGVCIMFSSVVIADPSIVSVVTDPANPKPESTVTVTANISGDDITSVKFNVSECNSKIGICINFYPINMERKSDGEYEATFTLQEKKGDTDYIEYSRFTVISNGITYTLNDKYKVNLSTDSGNNNQNGNNGPSNNNDDESKKGIPGFEVLTLLIALTIGIFLFKRMRLR